LKYLESPTSICCILPTFAKYISQVVSKRKCEENISYIAEPGDPTTSFIQLWKRALFNSIDEVSIRPIQRINTQGKRHIEREVYNYE
jgi:hypothetical protein